MADQLIIDGNNLAYAVHGYGRSGVIGREPLVRLIERWADGRCEQITIVFDGPPPREGLARQFASERVDVRFSGDVTADDVIVGMIHRAARPTDIRVVSSDNAILHEARYRRCDTCDAASFAAKLQQREKPRRPPGKRSFQKPRVDSPDEIDEWIDTLGATDLGPIDDAEAMGL